MSFCWDDMRLDALKLNTRLTLGFSILGLFFFTYGLIFYQNQKLESDNFQTFSLANAQKLRYAHLEQEVLEAQYLAKDYVISGSPVTQRRFHEQVNEIEILLAESMSLERLGTSKDILAEISSRLKNYMSNFNIVVKNRRATDALLNQEMPSRTKALEVMTQSLQDTPTASVLLHLIDKAEKEVLSYVITYQASRIMTAMDHLDRLVALARERSLDDLARESKALKSFVIDLSESTKAYLYFVNVLMASDAAELVHQSRVLDDLAQRHLEEVTLHIADIRRQSLTTTFALCATLLVVGLALAIGLGLSITRPLGKIRTTLSELAHGKSDLEIPAIDYRDEIGDLARSANIFKERNQQTERLLKESKALAGTLAAKERELEESNQELEQFVFTVSHDLKSPLVTAMGYIGIVRKLLDRGMPEEAMSKLDRVVRSNERMSQLINDLLELSRVGRVQIEMEPIDMEELVAEVTIPMIQNAEEGTLELHTRRPLYPVRGNRSRILQVFENLLGNARKYGVSPDGILRVEIYCEQREKNLVYCIEDAGRGIEPEFREKVFGLFSRLDNTTEGTGIGLAIVRKVMDFHHGSVWIESPPERGARFCLCFPSLDQPS